MVKYAPRKVYIRESGGYVELSYTEFCRCRESDQTYMDKLFIPIQGCLLEVVREQYTDFYRDKERWRYLQKLDTKNRLLSLDGFTDSEGNPLDFITDEAVDIAETVVNAVMVDRLKAALPLLSDSEQELIQAIFFDGLSEREVSALSDINAFNAGKKRDKALDLLSAWLPDVEKFSKEIGKQQAYIDSLKERIGQESDYAGRMRDEKYEQELKVQKANQKIFELQRTNEQMGRLLSKIPPEVLEELQKNHRSRAKER